MSLGMYLCIEDVFLKKRRKQEVRLEAGINKQASKEKHVLSNGKTLGSEKSK